MDVKVDDLGSECLSTEELAELMHVKAQSIRGAHCRSGNYLGMVPIKLPSRLLLWPKKQVEELLMKQKKDRGGISDELERVKKQRDILLDALVLAKIQGSKLDRDRIIDEAIAAAESLNSEL